ncbi:DUF4811 domain-containing protein [uncultured Limosilactobacillus sp.]|uniref:DUF4811 domain-containing protein n=1 Tax=uncultured Limosilactobacillus sp. TaxID=2837629 RepID=UPI0025F2A50C|nr:DUF4811 domain-containing protein [uncultured Limosilactobacillus sp.]
MLIYLSFASAVGLYLCSMFLKKGRKIGTGVFAILFMLTTAGVTANYSHHWGMKKVTTTTSKVIYSAAGPKLPINLYQPVGTSGQDNVFIYKTTPHQKQSQHTEANELTYSTAKTTTGQQARLVTTETRWRYQNQFSKFLFIGSGINNKLVHRTNTLYYPKGYLRVTVKQAQRLKKQLTTQSPAEQAAMMQKLRQQSN